MRNFFGLKRKEPDMPETDVPHFETFDGFRSKDIRRTANDDVVPETFSFDMSREQLAAYLQKAEAMGQKWKLGGQGPLD